MKNLLLLVILGFSLFRCSTNETPKPNKIMGTWKMVYAEIMENDSLKIKDLTHTHFIKIINNSHFSFFNQEKNSAENFYGGGGTYTLHGNDYVETLSFTSVEALKNHQFPFIVEFKGDTLVQSGVEEIEAAGIKQNIIEKYIKIH